MFPGADQGQKYFELSTAPFDALFLTPQNQYRLICNIFEPYDGINQPLSGHVPTIKICPKCLEEDKQKYGEGYLHRAHNLTGVCKCHIHDVDLLEFVGKRGDECRYKKDDYQPNKEANTDIKYAQYAKALLDANIQTNIKELQRVVLNKAYQEGMLTNTDSRHKFTIKVNTEMEDVTKDLFYGEHVAAIRFIPLLMHFFPEVDELAKQLPQTDKIVSEHTCRCGKKYYQGWWRYGFGLRACQCRPYQDMNEKFKDMVKLIRHDEYYTNDEFQSISTPITIWHRYCDNFKDYNPREFLFGTAQCECETVVTHGEARRNIERNRGFKLIDFTRANDLVTIKSEKCGHIFQCRYYKFLKSPDCRVCHPSAMNSAGFEERVRMLVGDEYTVVSPFESQNKKVRIRHNVCGCTQEYAPKQFLSGQRCKTCKCVVSKEKLAQYLDQYSRGRYVITGSKNQFVTVLDTQENKTLQLMPIRIIQEILRPTPSDILPVGNPDKTIRITSAWEDALGLFKEYVQQYGIESLTNETKYNGFGLGVWVKKQRSAYNRGDLSVKSVQLLKDAGFIFDKQDEIWMQRYEMLRSIYGKQFITRDTECDGVKIGAWLKNQKKECSYGRLSWERIDLLQKLDINILRPQKQYSVFSDKVKHAKITYDEEKRLLLIKPNVFIQSNSSLHKLNKWICIDDVWYIGLSIDNCTQDQLDTVVTFFKNRKYEILINADDFYNLTGAEALKSPEKYKRLWYIEDGIMYTNNPQAIQVVFDLKTYKNL